MSKLSRKDIIGRWQTSDGKKKQEQIINSLINNRSIEKLPFIEYIDGYYDLRGLSFDNKTKFNNVEIKNIDFSYSNFNCLILDECTIENVVFGMCDCTEMLQYGCNFNKCKFIKSKFLNAGFGIDGEYTNIIFEDSNFKGAMFFYPVFKKSIFRNCKFDNVDFKASHFINVKFIGKLDDAWFRGESPYPDEQKKHRDAGHFLNPMIVDFSEAELWYITYSDKCDLTKVILPNDGNHFLLYNLKKVLVDLENELKNNHDEKEKKFLYVFIEMYKYHAVNQDMVIINRKQVISRAEYYIGKDFKAFSEKFIDKLMQYNESTTRWSQSE